MSKTKALFEEETHSIVVCAMEVLKVLGHGLLREPYQNALAVEFGLRGIPYQRNQRFDVLYKNKTVGKFKPELICFDKIVVDTAVIPRIGDHELEQVLNHLRITRLRVGVLLNFKHSKLEWKRVVL